MPHVQGLWWAKVPLLYPGPFHSRMIMFRGEKTMTQAIAHDYLIIGAGPAGIQLGYFFAKSGKDYLILEAADSAGAFFEKYPRHRKLLSINKIYTGYQNRDVQLRYDWNSLLCEDERL